MNKMMKNIFKCFIGSILVLLFGPLLSPVSEQWYQVYFEPFYWVFGVLGCIILSGIIVYFIEVNPRQFYHCINIFPTSIFITMSTLGLIASLSLISLIDDIFIKIILLISLIVLYLFLIYVFMHRGVCIYKKEKIRIFKFKIKTYITNKIDSINFKYQNKKCIITILINNYKEEFKLSSFSARLIENRMKQMINYNI